MRGLTLAAAAAGALAAVVVPASAALAGPSYTFSNYVDTTGPYVTVSQAAINDNGVVAFHGALSNVERGIFVGPDPATDTVVTEAGPFSGPRGPVINNAGVVAFQSFLDDGTDGIFTGPDPVANAVATSAGAYSSFDTSAINDAGVIVFQAGLDSGDLGVFRGPDPVADVVGRTPAYTGLGGADVNNAGLIAFVASVGGEGGIFTGPDPSTGAIVRQGPDDSGPTALSVALNDAGHAAFYGRVPAVSNGDGVFVADGAGGITVIALAGQGFNDYAAFNPPAINDADFVAFLALLGDGRHGIFTGADPSADKVLATGDSLFGSTVTFVNMTRFGLNDAGQIAINYRLADGREGIAIATPEGINPIPLPPAVWAGLAGLALAGAAARRARSRSNGMNGR